MAQHNGVTFSQNEKIIVALPGEHTVAIERHHASAVLGAVLSPVPNCVKTNPQEMEQEQHQEQQLQQPMQEKQAEAGPQLEMNQPQPSSSCDHEMQCEQPNDDPSKPRMQVRA